METKPEEKVFKEVQTLVSLNCTPPPPPPTQVPRIAKQPSLISRPPAKVEVAVEEARNTPSMLRLPTTVEDPTETKPAFKLARLATVKVDEALNDPLTLSIPEKVEEAELASRPPLRYAKLATVKVLEAFKEPLTFKIPAKVEEAEW